MACILSPSGGLSSANYNYLKCWFILVHDGKEVYETIFLWGFKKPSSEIKKALFELPGYSNKKYRSDFDASQRKKIEAGDLSNFDLNLFYLLLQRICSLPSQTGNMWGKNNENVDELPSILFRIKMKRNDLAHTNTEITEPEMLRQIDELKCLFMRALEKAAKFYDVGNQTLGEVKDKISFHIISLQNSNSLISQQDMKEIAEEKVKLAKNEAQADLSLYYKYFSKVLLGPWTIAENFHNVKDVFTEPVIKQSKGNILAQQLTEDESTIDIQHIFTSKFPDNSTPSFILVLSPSGMGKTTLVKYLIQSWIEKNSNIEGLDSVDLVLYMDCRGSWIKSFDDLIISLMPNTLKLFEVRELKILMATMNVLIIIDNVDEIPEDTLPTYEELLRMNSDNFRILATSTQNLSQIMNKKFHERHLNLRLEGISNSKISTCISKIYNSLCFPKCSLPSDEDIEMFILDYISKSSIYSRDAVGSPEILFHLFFNWLMQGKRNSIYTTKTQLLLATHELLNLKLFEKVGSNLKTKLFEQKILYDKLNSFFDDLFQVAYQTLKEGEGEINSSLFNSLINTCERLNISNSILKEVLCITEKPKEMFPRNYAGITFPSTSLHVFYCAMYIVKTSFEDGRLNLDVVGKAFYENLIKRNIYLMLIKFVIGILSYNDSSNIKSTFQLILHHIYTNYKQCTTNSWLECWEEVKCDRSVLPDIKQYVGENWNLEDEEINAVLLNILKHLQPSKISLTLCKNPKEIHFIMKVLEQCSQIENISITLQMYHNFWVNKTEVCDKYLNVLLSNKISHNLESFAGKLSAEYILRVPSSLKRLALHIKPEEITILNTSLIKLNRLILLYVNLDISFDFPATRVPRLKLPNTNVLLYVDIWNINDRRILWACDALLSFSAAYCRLALRKSTLNFKDCKFFIENLRNRRIHIDSLIIGSTKSFTSEEEKYLAEIASNFECSEVKVIQI